MGLEEKTDVNTEIELEGLEKPLETKLLELNQLTAHLSTILGNMSQGLIFINKNGVINTYNAASEILIGVEEKKILYQSYWKNFSDTFFGFSLKEVLKEQFSPPPEIITFQSSLGIERVMEVTATYLDQPTNSQGVMIMLRDITELQRLDKETKRADRLKALGEMAAHVAHQVRNPLGGIKGFAALLSEDLKNQPELQQLSLSIMEGVDALNDVVTQILDFSRPLLAKKRLVDLVRLMRDLVEETSRDPHLSNDISLQMITSCSECMLEIDPFLVKQALLNLMKNGIEAMEEGGALTLSLEKKGNQVIVGVADTGCGISETDMGWLFQPFFTTKPKGNGFGLCEVDKIMGAHLGKIEVSSVLNEGTYFTLTFYR